MTATHALQALLEASQSVTEHRPWPRVMVTPETWNTLLEGLASGAWTLLGLWGEPVMVHLAVREGASGTLAIASLPCPTGQFPSVGRCHPPAQRLERTLVDLTGLRPMDAVDARPWLDHGR